MTRWFVTPDLHGSVELAEGLLRTADVPLTPEARKRAGIVSVQLGDLANCTLRDAGHDAAILNAALRWFDIVLPGNHEHPYWGGPRFAGFARVPEVEEGLRQIERARLLTPSLCVGDVLVTHAGVTPDWGFESAYKAMCAIGRAWKVDRSGPLFSRIGRARGGSAPLGGILWSHFTEPRAPFRQIHGHTVMPEGPYAKAPDGDPIALGIRSFPGQGPAGTLNIDVGAGKSSGRLVGAWLDEDGAVELVEYRSGA